MMLRGLLLLLLLLLPGVQLYRLASKSRSSASNLLSPPLVLRDSSKGGFGKARQYTPHQQLEVTRPNEFREVQGRFSKFLAKRCESFERLKGGENNFNVACDLYARLGGTSTFWFVGKLIHHPTQLTMDQALSIELPVVIEYSKALRPKELASPLATVANQDLQIWYARGNSEMDVAQNKVALTRLFPLPLEEYSQVLTSGVEELIGFEPEIYQGGEVGFRCVRDDEGNPVKPAFEVMTREGPGP